MNLRIASPSLAILTQIKAGIRYIMRLPLLTFSAGLTLYSAGESPSGLIERADRAIVLRQAHGAKPPRPADTGIGPRVCRR